MKQRHKMRRFLLELFGVGRSKPASPEVLKKVRESRKKVEEARKKK